MVGTKSGATGKIPTPSATALDGRKKPFGASKSAATKPEVRIFVSYSHLDDASREKLAKHLATLAREDVNIWFDVDIHAGEELDPEVSRALRRAHLFVALIRAITYLTQGGGLMSSLSWVTRRSSRGHPYHVLEPPVPRIRDEYLDCVVYLYRSEVEAEAGERAGGSGFLVGVPSEGLRQNFWFLYAVSNRHVIKKATTLRLNASDGRMTILPTARDSWTIHPDGDDLAACLISFDPKDYKFNHVPISSFLSKGIIEQYKIGPGDDCFIVGRFINHEGRQGNLPTVRFGNIGQMPWESIKQDDEFEQESFLVEMRSIGGYSGSPVFVQIPIWSDRPMVEGFNVPRQLAGWTGTPFGSLKAHGPWLLGVDWGHLNSWEPVCRANGIPVNPNPSEMQVKLNTGMAAVVPAWKLAELLDKGPLAEAREVVTKQVLAHEANNPPVVTSD